MASLINVILTISTLLTAALCIPNVTVVPAEGGCSAYPGYDASIGTAGPWTIILNSCDNSTIEGFGDSCQVIRRAGDTGIHEGRITIVNENDLAKIAIRCNDNLPSGPGGLEGYTPTGVSGIAWNQVNLTDIPYDAELGWGFGQYGTPVEAYHHYVDGALQDGLFLGQGNVTTWGVKLYPVDESGTLDGLPYWGLRLLGPESTVPTANGTVALMDGEYMTFLMVTGS